MFKPYTLKKNYYNFFLHVSFIVLLFFLNSCKNSEKENNITFFGGKIKNPKEAYVYFLKNEKIIDSAKINKHKRFSFHLDSIDTGLYTFSHGGEFQYLYLEPRDSLLIYLNTWDFDESLIFSGKESAKNNFMINLFLQQEKIEKEFTNYYNLDEDEFSKKVDDYKNKLMLQYDAFIKTEGKKPTKFFDNLVKAIINYPLYSKKEFYPLWHKNSKNLNDYPDINNHFYDYRKNLNYNDTSLFHLRAYTYYIESLLYNLAYNKQKQNPKNNNFSLNFMKSVNEILVDEKLKNKYLASGFWGSFKDQLTEEQQKECQRYFFNNCTDKIYIKEAKHAIDQCVNLKNGDKLPKLFVKDSSNNQINFNKIINNKNTAIYFWPKDDYRRKMLLKKLNKYKQKYPEILFVGIERNKSNNNWKEFLTENKITFNNQYLMDESCEMYSLFDGDIARTILVNNQGIVKNSFIFFNDSYNLEKNLKTLKKQ